MADPGLVALGNASLALNEVGAQMKALRTRITQLEAALIAWYEACDDEERKWAMERTIPLVRDLPQRFSDELPQAPMPCPGFNSGACVPGKYCGRRLGYAYPCPGQPIFGDPIR